jgi:hypothetical protein
MKKSMISVFVVALIILLSVCAVLAQAEKPKQTLWWVTEYVIKPSKVSEYHTLMKDFVKHCAKNECEFTWYMWTDYSFHYYSSRRVKDYNSINVIDEKMDPIVKSWGDDELQTWYETLEFKKSFFLRVSSDLQYFPESPRLKSDERKFALWDVYHIIPGKVKEFSQILQKLKTILRTNDYPNQLQFMRDDIGMEGPQFIGLSYAKNRADFWEENKKMWNMLGKEGQDLYNDILKLTKRRESRAFWHVKNLSYTPKKE